MHVCLVNSRTSVRISSQCRKFTSFAQCQMLDDDSDVLSAFGSRCSAEVTLLIGHSLNANVNLLFADGRGQLVVADIAVKSFDFRVMAVYAPNTISERHSIDG